MKFRWAGEWPKDAPEAPAIPPPAAKELKRENVVLHGWRNFRLDGEGYLYGSYDHRWETRSLTAECEGDKDRCASHVAKPPQTNMWMPLPSDSRSRIYGGYECLCGIHSFRERSQVSYQDQIIAQCVMWGVVAEHTDGWRSTECRIERLFVPRDASAEYARELLEARYPDVPVEIFEPDYVEPVGGGKSLAAVYGSLLGSSLAGVQITDTGWSQ